MRAIITCACLLGIAVSVEARLGETAAQLESRYGKPVKTHSSEPSSGTVLLMFQKGDISIEARLDSGVTSYICYRKKTVFTEDQIQEMLNRNAENGKWDAPTETTEKQGKKGKPSWSRQWLRDDGGKAVLERGFGLFPPAKTPEECWGLHFWADSLNEGAKRKTWRGKEEIDGL